MELVGAYIFCHPGAEPTTHTAVMTLPDGRLFVVGVSTVDEGVEVASRLVREERVGLIELCGAFGYDGTSKVTAALGGRIPVGMVVHQVGNAPGLAKLMGIE